MAKTCVARVPWWVQGWICISSIRFSIRFQSMSKLIYGWRCGKSDTTVSGWGWSTACGQDSIFQEDMLITADSECALKAAPWGFLQNRGLKSSEIGDYLRWGSRKHFNKINPSQFHERWHGPLRVSQPCDAVAGFDFHLQEFLMMVDGIRDGESWVPLYDLTPSLMPLGLSQAAVRHSPQGVRCRFLPTLMLSRGSGIDLWLLAALMHPWQQVDAAICASGGQ